MMTGRPPRKTAAAELDVPKSTPMVAMTSRPSARLPRENKRYRLRPARTDLRRIGAHIQSRSATAARMRAYRATGNARGEAPLGYAEVPEEAVMTSAAIR